MFVFLFSMVCQSVSFLGCLPMLLVDWLIRRVRPAVKRVRTQPGSNSIYQSVSRVPS